ncbi:nucleotide sugar dehydrogenase [Halobacterium litoreum]|uniref:UDP-N-acetyl-D-mannosamine dehydrogenase n=1 Tax=Halobacterium litoreum TaxID=2039234 RepID=A0ABD5NAM6_9EURY|nr:nucleotide sugar dehydrogenase [Halobacterium litoreum]UHH14728.1 nucleotide sugar dehydrogenase [Halobacterium litoreum]
MRIGIIGGGGHVGLPLGIVLADAGFSVTLIDKDETRLQTVESGELPFNEPGGEEMLETVLASGRLDTTTEIETAENCDVIMFVIGTPIDEHHNPQMDVLLDVVNEVIPNLSDNQLLIFRSTIYPGTTELVCETLEERGFTVGEDVYVSFAPERIAQHKAFEEIVGLPQLIGAPDDDSYERTAEVFNSILEEDCLRLNPTEAELGKLFTNMWRYLTFAAANEFHLITESFATHHNVNVNKILDKTGKNYPRFDVPSPGANVGGPCLTKDGWFLVDNIPFNELVSTAYQINEGMPAQIIKRMAEKSPDPSKISVLGMTFKRDSDDVRNSVSFKMEKQLQMKGYRNVVEVEPNVPGYDDLEDIEQSDWVILMTPHTEFEDFDSIQRRVNNDDCLYCDIWGVWDAARYQSDNGYFVGRELDDELSGETEVSL